MIARNDDLATGVQEHLDGFGLGNDLAVGVNNLVLGVFAVGDAPVGQLGQLLSSRTEDQLQPIRIVVPINPPGANFIGIEAINIDGLFDCAETIKVEAQQRRTSDDANGLDARPPG